MNEYNGFPIIESKYAEKTIQDWSGCRSKARAMRRHKKGIKTRMVVRTVPTAYMVNGKIYAHPTVVKGLSAVALTAQTA